MMNLPTEQELNVELELVMNGCRLESDIHHSQSTFFY